MNPAGARKARRWDYAYEKSRQASAAPERKFNLPRPGLPNLRMPRIPLLSVLLAVLGVMLAVFAVLLFNSSLFKVSKVEVRGVSSLNALVIAELAEAEGQNIFTLRLHEVERKLERNPYVRSATAKRVWPNGLQITIDERVPVGVWQVGEQRYLVDGEGFVLAVLLGEPPPGTAPILALDTTIPAPGELVDSDALSLITDLQASVPRETGELVASFEYSLQTGLTAITTSGVRVIFGDSKDYEFKLASLGGVFKEARTQGLPFTVIDLRFGESPALR
ncbi:MAG: FtsQ-type POTRA domain-containing protein [Dehalococcoidia bacterium]